MNLIFTIINLSRNFHGRICQEGTNTVHLLVKVTPHKFVLAFCLDGYLATPVVCEKTGVFKGEFGAEEIIVQPS